LHDQILHYLQALTPYRLHTGCRTPPPRVAKACRNRLNEEIIPLLPTGERFNQTISNLGHAALLHRCEPPIKVSAELTQETL
jgi:hypothetical protein